MPVYTLECKVMAPFLRFPCTVLLTFLTPASLVQKVLVLIPPVDGRETLHIVLVRKGPVAGCVYGAYCDFIVVWVCGYLLEDGGETLTVTAPGGVEIQQPYGD